MFSTEGQEKEQLALIQKIRNDPWEFSKYVFTKDESDKKNPIKRFPYELDYIKLYMRVWVRENRIAVPKSRRMKMTWTNVVLHLWDAWFHVGRHEGIVSKKEEDANFLIQDRFKFIVENLDKKIPRHLLPRHESKWCHLTFPEIHSKIQGFPQGEGQMRQFTLSNIMADEIAFWEQAEGSYSASLPTLEGGGRFTAVSSPAPGFFKRLCLDRFDDKDLAEQKEESTVEKRYPIEGVEMWKNKSNEFTVFQLHYTADPSKRSKEFKSGAKKGMSQKRYNQEYELQWETFAGHPVYSDFSSIFHGSKEKLYPHLGLPLLRGWDFGLCYSDDTEVMTKDGWKLFKDLTMQDEMATLNSKTFELEYEKPKKLVCFDYEEEMLEWENNNISMMVTPEHRIPYSRRDTPDIMRFARADQLEKEMSAHRYVYMNAKWNGEDRRNIMGWEPTTWASFMGMYLSEGCCDKVKNRVTVYQKECRVDFQEALDKTGLDWIRSEKNISWRATDKKLNDYLKKFGTSKKKYIPRIIKDGSIEVIKEFIKFYTAGDGHIRTRPNGSEEHTIFTASKIMADDFQECALKIGWTARIREVGPTESYYEKEDRIIKSSGGYSISFKKGFSRCELFQKDFKRVKYSGKIYCASVSHHTLYVRRKGRAHWNGNTPACIVCQLQGQTLVVLKEFTAVNMGTDRFSDIVLPECALEFPQWTDQKKDYLDFIDASGMFRKDTNEETNASVLAGKGLVCQAGAVSWEPRRRSVEKFLIRVHKAEPCFQLNLTECPMLVKGFNGGYRYPDSSMDLEPNKIRPLKDEHSHIHDALQMVTSRISQIMVRQKVTIPTPKYKQNY